MQDRSDLSGLFPPLSPVARLPQKAKRGWGARIAARARGLAVCAASVSAVLLGSGEARSNEGAFLSSRMTVSAPAGASNLCTRYTWACARSASVTPVSPAQMTLAATLNRQINRQVRSVSDQAQYGKQEHWALPTARGGDCEDFALLKKKRLMQAGVDPQNLLITTALDRRRNAHAVLIMRTPQGDFVLDNLRDDIVHWQRTGYTFLRMQNPANPALWTAVIEGGILRNDNAVSTPRVAQVNRNLRQAAETYSR